MLRAVARGGQRGEEFLENQPQKQAKSGKMGRKRGKWEENGKLAGSLPYGPDHAFVIQSSTHLCIHLHALDIVS